MARSIKHENVARSPGTHASPCISCITSPLSLLPVDFKAEEGDPPCTATLISSVSMRGARNWTRRIIVLLSTVSRWRELSLFFFFFLVDEVLITIKWRDPLPVFGRLEIYGGSISPIIANWADTFLSGHRSSRLAFGLRIFFLKCILFLDILILIYF